MGRWFRLAYVIMMLIAVYSARGEQNGGPANLCLNPGFELLNPAGDNFPLNWARVVGDVDKVVVAIDQDAHSGGVAVRMTADTAAAGLNSPPIKIRSGKVTFYYKALQANADGNNLQFFVIALPTHGGELTRIGYAVPKEHIGDGQWHQGVLAFDFTGTEATAILISPRVNEASGTGKGDWIVDDIVCIEQKVGPRPEIAAFYALDTVMLIGKPTTFGVQLDNPGDEPTPRSKLRLMLPPEVELGEGSSPVEIDIQPLAPQRSQRFIWQLIGKRQTEFDLTVEWTGKGISAKRIRHALCMEKRDPRRECSRADGFWRLMPKPIALQKDNALPLVPLETKPSSELPDSYIGVNAHLPRPADYERIFEPGFLIDGDRQTSWSARPHATPVPGPLDWVQVDFASARKVSEIRLVPYWKAEGFPIDFTVRLRKGGQWTTCYDGWQIRPTQSTGEGDKQPFVIPVTADVKADAVRIDVSRFRAVSSFFTDCAGTFACRLSEVEVIDKDGVNIASAERGGKVSVSSTFRSYFSSKEIIDKTYPELFNLGVKWNRVNQWGDWTCWAIVERVKGNYQFDPVTDQAITDTVKNGVNILFTLDYGNALYEDTPWHVNPGPVWRHSHPFTGDGGPTKPESIEGFVNYARFIAKHLKGRVKHYEIWHEENSWAWYGYPPDPKAFGTLLRETAKALKEIDPKIKVISGGTAALAPTFLTEALAEGAGPYLDGIAFHPYTMPYPEMGLGALDVVDGKQVGKSTEQLGFKTYREMLAFLRKTFEPFIPHCEIWANEWNAMPTREDVPYGGTSEICVAKQAARYYLMNTLERVYTGWWQLCSPNYLYELGIVRADDFSRPPLFYTIQAMSTLLSGAKRDPSIEVDVIGEAPELFCETLEGRDGEKMIAVWSAVPPVDDYAGKRISLKIHVPEAKTVDAVDTLHVLVQPLKTEQDTDGLLIEGLLAMDYPVIVRIR